MTVSLVLECRYAHIFVGDGIFIRVKDSIKHC